MVIVRIAFTVVGRGDGGKLKIPDTFFLLKQPQNDASITISNIFKCMEDRTTPCLMSSNLLVSIRSVLKMFHMIFSTFFSTAIVVHIRKW